MAKTFQLGRPEPAAEVERRLALGGIGDLIKDATGNRVFASLRQMEDAIESELRPLWENPERVRTLVGGGWIRSQVNASSN